MTVTRRGAARQEFGDLLLALAGLLVACALAVAAALAGPVVILGLADVPQWHSQRDRIVSFAGLLSLITGALGKFGQDIALMARQGGEIVLSGGGSSAIAREQDPVSAEALVTLARFNATALAGLHQSLVHEQERSGSAWTLEWMALPPMVVATGAALARGLSLLDALRITAKR